MLEQLKAKTHFENDGERNRLILEIAGDIPVIEFQVDMIRSNRIPGLLPLDMRRVDSRIQLQYDVTGKWRLKDLLDNKEFTGLEFVALLEKLIQALTGSEAYLLEITQFELSEEHIFLDGNLEPRLLYLPVKNTQNIHERFKELLLQLIIYRARIKDQDSGPVISGILNTLKRENFNLYSFQKTLRTLSSQSETRPVVAEPIYKPAAPVSLGDLVPPENRPVPPQINQPKSVMKKSEPVKTQHKSQEKAQFQTITEYKSKTKYKPWVVIVILIFQVALAAGVLFGYGPVYGATEDATTAYAAMALMVLCLDGLALKNLLKAENRIEVQIPIQKKVKVQSDAAQPLKAAPQPIAPPSPPVNFNKQVISNSSLNIPGTAAYDTELLTPAHMPGSGANDTVVLTAQPAAPYLVRKGPIQEIIRLKQPSLVLGRQADMADYVIDDPAIGRMHAELSWASSLYQIRDMNSKNGTFVNGQRLSGPLPVNLFIGDEIKLGPLEYTLAQD